MTNPKYWLALGLLVFAGSALAKPAPWYQWRSKLDGKIVCAQASPGKGWSRVPGRYGNPRCEKSPLRS